MKNEKIAENSAVPLQLITGGRSGGEGNWLEELKVGTAFCCRQMNFQLETLETYLITFRKGNVTLLGYCLGEKETLFYVDTKKFSKRYELVEVLAIQEPQQQEEQEVHDG